MIVSKVTTASFEMGYLRFGSGARTLVILPGLSVQRVLPAAEQIRKQYSIFSTDFTVYLFDRRDSLPPVYSPYAIADDTAEAMRTLGLRDACVFGASQGGMAAMALAASYPALVQRLALGSAAARTDAHSEAVLRTWIALARQKDAAALFLTFGETVLPPTLFQANRDALSAAAQSVTEGDLARFITLAESLIGFNILDKLADILCPVLAVGDTDDRIFSADASREIVRRVGNQTDSEWYMYHGFGHAAYDAAPDYVHRLYAFFTQSP